MNIVGVFDNDEQRVGNRLSGMKTYLARNEEDLTPILKELENDKNIRNCCF